MTQPPDDRTQRFDPFRDDDDDNTRAMPPVRPEDDDTQFFAFDDDDRTRQVPAYPDDATQVLPADATRAYPADATAPMPPVGGARGSAAPVPPGGNVYGGGTREYVAYAEDDDEPPRSGRRTALLIGGILLAILLVTAGGVLAGTTFFGSPGTEPTSAPLTAVPSPTETPSALPSESPSPEFSTAPPPPEGPGPRILGLTAPARADCTNGGSTSIELDWRVADADRVTVSVDGSEYQSYHPDDDPVSVPFPCDGRAHTYQVAAFSNDDRQSRPWEVTVRPEVPQETATPLFPEPTPS